MMAGVVLAGSSYCSSSDGGCVREAMGVTIMQYLGLTGGGVVSSTGIEIAGAVAGTRPGGGRWTANDCA